MTITDTVRLLVGTTDTRVTAHIGPDQLFTDRCDHCHQRAVILTDTLTTHTRGATHEGGIYCLNHGIDAIDDLVWTDCDEITVTVPAYLVSPATPIAA